VSKRILVLYYSQSGQSARAAASFVSTIDPSRFEVLMEPVRAQTGYPFPWSFWGFFGVLPDCVLGRAPEIEAPGFAPDDRFDLVILVYQVWFLAPSLPIQGFLASPWARVLRDTRVITLVVCRNMWHTASETMKRKLAELGAIHIDNVVITDPSPPIASFVTTPRWMFTGKRDPFMGFPPAGVPEAEIRRLSRFGTAISQAEGALDGHDARSILRGLGAVEVESRFVLPELIGRLSFRPWALAIDAAGRLGGLARRAATFLFFLYLVFAILVLVPLAALARLILHPLIKRPIAAYVERLKRPSGIDTGNLELS
jgi:hypothetical protein